MEENELVVLLQENGFSKKQIDSLKKVSEMQSLTLYNTVNELARRFPRSLMLHMLVLFIVCLTYISDHDQEYYSPRYLLVYISVLCITFIIFHFFAPLYQGYKATKVLKKIKHSDLNGKQKIN